MEEHVHELARQASSGLVLLEACRLVWPRRALGRAIPPFSPPTLAAATYVRRSTVARYKDVTLPLQHGLSALFSPVDHSPALFSSFSSSSSNRL